MTDRHEATIAAIDAVDPGWFAPLERHAARRLADLVGETDPRVQLALALVARQVRLGHVCLEVRAMRGAPGPMDEFGGRLGDLGWPDGAEWLEALAASPMVAAVADGAALDAVPVEPRPLVLEPHSGRLYLRRWWEHEAALARDLAARAAEPAGHDAARLDLGLARLFPPVDGPAERGNRDQAAAASRAVRRRLTVITGGPGTGKTSVVVRVLALLVEQAEAVGTSPPRVVLLAPTGKAAARMKEAVTAARDRLDVSEAVRAAIPAEASTIHRALRPRRDGTFRRGTQDPLPADVVVVDEASMIDVALMRALVDAVRPEARLVVLGDRDQLASIDAGAVLADLCAPPLASVPDPDGAVRGGVGDRGSGRSVGPLTACIATLDYSFRFGAETGIGALASAILTGDAERALHVLTDAGYGDITWVTARPVDGFGRLHTTMGELVARGYHPYLAALPASGARADDAARALAALGGFRVLCGHRRGPLGVGTLGRAVAASLELSGLIAPVGQHWHGRPVIVTRNDYSTMLFNGDVGLVASDGADPRRLRAWFTGSDGLPRELSPARLPPHETVYAMSIHKSQGSEFDAVAVVLPDDGSPLLTRELLYTAVTRARRSVTLFGSEAALRTAIRRRVERASGLRARLWGS